MTWRLVDTDICAPPYSAAADEAIALARSKDLVPDTLHFYRRSVPTVSLGYFQSASEDINRDFCDEHGIQIVRRATGGSAVYTDKNHLIYGLMTDESPMPLDKEETYRKVCSALVGGLAHMGIAATFKPVNDVLVNGRKISGSAQMRRWGVVLQHGTLILANDTKKMFGALNVDRGKAKHITSLEEVLGRKPPVSDVKSALVKGFEEVFGARFEPGELTDFEIDKIEELIAEKYGNDQWNFRK